MKQILKSQYLAALEMLRRAIEDCPESLWDDAAFKNRFWRVAYHVLFYTDLYLSRSESDFRPWQKHQPDSHVLGEMPPGWPYRQPKPCRPYSKVEVLESWEQCRQSVGERLEATDLDAPSGFEWLPMNKLELQIYNIRHIQHHAAQLIERVRQGTGKGVDWVGRTEVRR